MSVPLLNGISEVADQYDAFILDIFGVIHDGIRPFPGTYDCLSQLQAAGKQVCLLSNSPRRAKGAAAQMEAMGLPPSLYNHIVTSGEATYQSLQNRGDDLGNNCWLIGTSMIDEIVRGHDLNLLDGPDGASFILNAIPGTERKTIEMLKAQLQIAADQNLPMICANPDLVVNIGTEQYECAGTFAAYYESVGGHVVYHGKPHSPVYEWCHDLLGGIDKSKICAVGDSFHTDVAGANRFGIDCVMNLVGIHWEEIQMDHAPDEADLDKLCNVIDAQPHKPTYALAGFAW